MAAVVGSLETRLVILKSYCLCILFSFTLAGETGDVTNNTFVPSFRMRQLGDKQGDT